MKNPVFCSCGRALEMVITREKVTMRCPEHGLRFRYVVDCAEPPTAEPVPKPKPARPAR